MIRWQTVSSEVVVPGDEHEAVHRGRSRALIEIDGDRAGAGEHGGGVGRAPLRDTSAARRRTSGSSHRCRGGRCSRRSTGGRPTTAGSLSSVVGSLSPVVGASVVMGSSTTSTASVVSASVVSASVVMASVVMGALGDVVGSGRRPRFRRRRRTRRPPSPSARRPAARRGRPARWFERCTSDPIGRGRIGGHRRRHRVGRSDRIVVGVEEELSGDGDDHEDGDDRRCRSTPTVAPSASSPARAELLARGVPCWPSDVLVSQFPQWPDDTGRAGSDLVNAARAASTSIEM